MQIKFQAIKNKFNTWFQGLLKKEQIGVVVATFFVLFWLSFQIYEPVNSKLKKIESEITRSESTLKSIPGEIEKFLRLKKRKEEAESSLKDVELAQGGLAHLETLITEKAKVDKNAFTIKPRNPLKISDRYEQSPFSVRLETDSYENFVNFLKELVQGSKKMVLNRMYLSRSRDNVKIVAELEVSALKPIVQ